MPGIGRKLGTQRQIRLSPCFQGVHFMGVNQRMQHFMEGYGVQRTGKVPQQLAPQLGRDPLWDSGQITEHLGALAFPSLNVSTWGC